MRHNIIIAVAAAAMVLAGSVESMAQEKSRLGREAITAMFDAARKASTWSIDGKCQWGYFFFDPDRLKLQKAGAKLEEEGYHLVRVRGPMKSKTGFRYILHVEKVEQLTVDTLMARNEQLKAFAAKQGLESYDGMEVAPLSSGKCDDAK
jgi:Regulator of ribonuclease activity B